MKRLRHSFPVMGTVASLVAVTDPATFAVAVAEVVGTLEAADRRFSPYRADSELARLRGGEGLGGPASPEMRSVLDGCGLMELLTDHAFTARTPGGVIDTTGFVKGWAMARSARVLSDHGVTAWLLNVGGDVVGHAAPGGRPWHVAVRHPVYPAVVSQIVPLRDGAVATSGDYERGPHVWHLGHRGARMGSCTVTGPRIDIADALATACWAAAPEDVGFMNRFPDYQVMFLGEQTLVSEGFPLVGIAA